MKAENDDTKGSLDNALRDKVKLKVCIAMQTRCVVLLCGSVVERYFSRIGSEVQRVAGQTTVLLQVSRRLANSLTKHPAN